MQKNRPSQHNCAWLHLKPYLAEWARHRFHVDAATGAVELPRFLMVYSTVWRLMERPEGRTPCVPDGTADAGWVRLRLPSRRTGADGLPRKDASLYNYLPERAQGEIAASLQLLFDEDVFRHVACGRREGTPYKDLAVSFCRRRGITAISPEGVLKRYTRLLDAAVPADSRRKWTRSEPRKSPYHRQKTTV